MKYRLIAAHPTKLGTVFIAQTPDGRFHPLWQDESLGSYAHARQAIEDVAGGHTFTPSDGTDLGSLGISDDPADWVDPRAST